MKNIRNAIAAAVIAASAFLAGASLPTPIQSQNVAGEAQPGPTGSGVLSDWTNMSHGLYCYQPGGKIVLSNVKATRQTAPAVSAAFSCPSEDIRVYGDSITNGAKTYLATEYNSRGYTLMVDAWSGRPTTPIADAVELENSFPGIVIIASGTNDLFNAAVMAAQINRIKSHIAAVSPGTKLFWVDVQATRWAQTDTIERNDQRNSMAVNLAIYQNIPVNRIIQWTQRFMSNPALLENYMADGIHPKPVTGYTYYAAIQRTWLDSLGGI